LKALLSPGRFEPHILYASTHPEFCTAETSPLSLPGRKGRQNNTPFPSRSESASFACLIRTEEPVRNEVSAGKAGFRLETDQSGLDRIVGVANGFGVIAAFLIPISTATPTRSNKIGGTAALEKFVVSCFLKFAWGYP
jgi:hypothetical protein